MAFAKFEENRFRIDGEIAENHAILVNLTASIVRREELRVGGKCIVYKCVINPYSAGIDFNRQNLTSTDVRF